MCVISVSAFDVDDVHTVNEGCEKAIVKSLGDAGVEVSILSITQFSDKFSNGFLIPQ